MIDPANHVVTFGELLLRLSPPGDERLLQSPELRTYFGGCEANVAVGLARLGVAAEYVTRVPDSPIGDAAIRALRAEGVRGDRILRGGRRLGLYFVERGSDIRAMRVVYDRADSGFATLDPGELAWDELLTGATWLNVSGITPALGDGPRQAVLDAVQAARAAGVRVVVDLNYRPVLWGDRDPRPTMRQLTEGAELVIGNPGAVDAMLGIPAGAACDTAARVRDELGAREVALTHRTVRSASEHAWSAALLDADGQFHQSREYVVRVVDRVGGGDSFVAAFLFARMDGRAPAAALAFATAASALKLTIPGDFNRVSVRDVDDLLKTE